MNLSFDLGNGTAVGLVGPTVFSVGADDKHVVVKQHPSRDPFGYALALARRPLSADPLGSKERIDCEI